MGRPLRLITGLAFAQVAASAVLLVLRDSGARVDVSVTNGHLTQMPGAVFWACTGLLVLAWTYLLAGSLHADPRLRVLALALFTGATLAGGTNASLESPQRWLGVALLVAIWGVAISTWLMDRKLSSGDRDRNWMRTTIFLVLLTLVVLLYANAWWGAGAHGTPRAFTLGISIQVAIVSLLLIPVLLLTGSEFAEWGKLAGERATRLLGEVRGTAVLRAAAALVAAAVLAGLVARFGVGAMLKQAALGGILFGVVLLVRGGRGGRSVETRTGVPKLAVAAAAATIAGIFLAGSFLSSSGEDTEARRLPVLGELAVFHRPAAPKFSLLYPAAWRTSSIAGAGTVGTAFSGAPAGDPAFFEVVRLPQPPQVAERALPATLVGALRLLNPGAAITTHRPKTKSGTRTPFAIRLPDGTELVGSAWAREREGSEWLLFGYGLRQLNHVNAPAFATMTRSWSTEPADETEPGGEGSATGTEGMGMLETRGGPDVVDKVIALCAGAWFMAAALAGVGLARGFRPLRGPRASAAALFAVVTGAAFVLAALPQVWLVVFGSVPDWMPGLRVAGFQAIAGLATLTAVATTLIFRRDEREMHTLERLLGLCVGLQALAWFIDLYTGAIESGGRFTLVAALILLLALFWELATSGAAATNGHGRLLPRSARVMLYCGYIVLVATAIVYFSSLHTEATGNGIETLFESDRWPRLGIQLLGAPLLITGFLLGIGWCRSAASNTSG